MEVEKFFHAYDIRGLIVDGLDENFYYVLGKSLVKFLKAKTLIVGYDIRPESKLFSDSLIKGITESGCSVVNIGEVPTEQLYFVTGSDLSFDGGIVITASHNPAGWNGAKIVGKGASAISKTNGLFEIRDLMIKDEFTTGESLGSVEVRDYYPQFKDKILSVLAGVEVPKMKIVVDAGNGIGGKVFDYIFGDLGLEVVKMYFEPDGKFPNHVPDPLKEENVKDIKNRIQVEKADLGIAIDGDADRVFFLDKQSRNPSGIFTGSIFLRYFAEKFPNSKIIHDPRVTWPIVQESEKYTLCPIVNKAGHSFFKERMKSEDASFGCEMSSHFFYKDYYYADSGMYTIAVMLKLISQGLDFSTELDYLYKNYIVSGEVNFKVENSEAIIQKIKAEYSDYFQLEIDGLSVEGEDFRFNLRRSNTEPLLRFCLEAKSKELIKTKFKELKTLIGGEQVNKAALADLN